MKKHLLSLLSVSILSFVLLSAHAAPIVTSEGVGPIKLGMKISDIPSSIDGFYDKLETQTRKKSVSWSGEEYTETYYLATFNGKPVFEIPIDNDDVRHILVLTEDLKTKSGLGILSTPANLLKVGAYISDGSGNGNSTLVLCDNVIFNDIPFTAAGIAKEKKSYEASTIEKASLADFERNGHAKSLTVSNYGNHLLWNLENQEITRKNLELLNSPTSNNPENPSQAVNTQSEKLPANQKILLIVILAIYLLIIGNIIYVNWIKGEWDSRHFAGSKAYIGVAIVLWFIAFLMDKEVLHLIYPTASIILYWLASFTTRQSANTPKGMSSVLKSVFSITDSIPITETRTVIKELEAGKIVSDKTEKDYGAKYYAGTFFTLFALAILVIFMIFIAFFNYLRNYVFYKR
ncbi:MAG: hypothetical protein J6Y32_05715 [Bacteroidales bacterium]|nr:hypothetical protein [Bacteroidales bacterium]